MSAEAGFAWRRAPLLLLGAVALISGLWSGLARLGALGSAPIPLLAHGPLMVSGFLGTVIALERAVAARAPWAFLGPLLCGVGGVSLVAGLPAGAALLTAGSLVVVVVLGLLAWRAPQLHHVVLFVAALGWLSGNAALALGRPVFEVVPSWALFLAGTIAAERLELTRVLPRSIAAQRLFVAALALVVAGAGVSFGALALGYRLLAAGSAALGLWLFRWDIARRTVRMRELTRFIAAALLSGYAWLLVSGVLGLALPFAPAGPHYDAVLHALFVGFVFSMIFGHAPLILPAVLGVRVTYTPRFYGHLALLHAATALRLAGDLGGLHPLRVAGAWGSAAAIVLFIASTALATARRLPQRAEAASASSARA